MVPLHMIMCNEMSNGVSERIFTKENHLLQTTFFDRPDKPFRIRIQIRRSRRQFDGLDAGIRKDAKKLSRIQRISIVDEIAAFRQRNHRRHPSESENSHLSMHLYKRMGGQWRG